MTPLSKLQKRHDNSHACWKKAACSMLEQSKTARESKKKKNLSYCHVSIQEIK